MTNPTTFSSRDNALTTEQPAWAAGVVLEIASPLLLGFPGMEFMWERQDQ